MSELIGSTFFWGGETFAPKLRVDTGKGKKNIQAFLQDTFLAATAKLVEAVGDLETVLGFEVSLTAFIRIGRLMSDVERAASRLYWSAFDT